MTCDWCGKDILVKQYKIIQFKHHFCSIDCKREWYAQVWSQQEWWKNESRKRGAKVSADAIGKTATRPQLLINEILNEMNIKYTNEYNCIYYSIDNYLDEYNLAIEVMGDYWHSNPFSYNLFEVSDMQKEIIGRDKAKKSFLKNKYNMQVLYLWETDIIKRPELCKMLIQKYIDLSGLLEDYNSFNYEIVDQQLKLRDELTIPYQDYKKLTA